MDSCNQCHLFVCLSVSKITHKCIYVCQPNMVGMGMVGIEVVNFGADPDPGVDLGSVLHFL